MGFSRHNTSNEVWQNIKRQTKDKRWRPFPGWEFWRRRSFQSPGNPSHWRVCGEFWNLWRPHNQEGEKNPHRLAPNCNSQWDGSSKRRLYTWTSPDGQHWNQTDYILCSQRWRSATQSTKTRPGADCGSDHEHLIMKFRLKLKKVGKTDRSFRYDLNQIPYDYTMEIRNRFKALDLIDRLPDELRTEVSDTV